MRNGATLSPCRTYRYDLWRTWIGGEGYAHTYFADNADLRMTAGDHAKRAAQLTTIRDDLARALEEGE